MGKRSIEGGKHEWGGPSENGKMRGPNTATVSTMNWCCAQTTEPKETRAIDFPDVHVIGME